jgi:hypothetical protein
MVNHIYLSTREAYEALQILQRYVDQKGNAEMQKMNDRYNDMLAEERLKNLKQKNIRDYFPRTN